MEMALSQRVESVLKRTIVWDAHSCMPLRPGDMSFMPQLERVREAGITVVSLNVSCDGVGGNDVFELLATLRHWVIGKGEHYILADTVHDIEIANTQRKLAVTFDIEGGNVISTYPGFVEIFYRLGVRWMLLAYNENNKLGGGCMNDDTGLTSYGRQIIHEMERVGMVLCCSHVGYRTACEAMEQSSQPVIFSHSNPAGAYRHPRNIPDDLMRKCAATGGVVNLNGVGMFLGKDEKGGPDNRTETLVRHIDYAAELIGAEHVGLGLDYVFDVSEVEDYARKNPAMFPTDGRESETYRQVEPERFPLIADALLKKGYGEHQVQGILGHNNLRVARQVWKPL
jgi:membrane dipeptidase